MLNNDAQEGEMKTYLIDCGSKRIPELLQVLGERGCEVEPVLLSTANDKNFREHDAAVVISGGPHLFTRPEGLQLHRKFAFIDRVNGPLLGICLGHQAIGLRYGARVHLGPVRRRTEQLQVHTAHALLEGLGDAFALEADHKEGIDLPEGFTLLANSGYYDNEIMACEDRPVFGVQCHPETSGEAGVRLIGNFVNVAKEYIK